MSRRLGVLGGRRVVICFAAGAVLVLAGLTVPPAGYPHVIVTKASLVEKPIVANTPTPVTIHFNGRIEPGFTQVILVDENKRERPLDVTSGPNGNTVTVDLPAMNPGMYALRYKVLAVDGHVTEGVLRFRVRPAQ